MGKKVLIFVLIIVCILIGFSIHISVSNDMIAKRVENELKETELPNNTEIVDSISAAGKLTGNGNGMQYFGAILIKTKLTKEELEDYYKQYKKNEWDFLVSKVKSSDIDKIEHGSYRFEKYNENDKEKYFMIYSWGISRGFLNDWDLRAH